MTKERTPYQLIAIVTQGLAHRIRTPLSIVSNELSCLALDGRSDEARRALIGCNQTAAVLKAALETVEQLNPAGESRMCDVVASLRKKGVVISGEASSERAVQFSKEYLENVLLVIDELFLIRNKEAVQDSFEWSLNVGQSTKRSLVLTGKRALSKFEFSAGTYANFSACLGKESGASLLEASVLDLSLREAGASVEIVVGKSVEVALGF